MRKAPITLLLLCFLLVNLHAAAAQSAWSVWLFTAETSHLREIDNNGAVLRDFTLPLPAGADPAQMPRSVAISHNGNLMAYVVRGLDNTPSLAVWDAQLLSFVGSYAMPANVNVSLEYSASPLNFSENDTQIAFGYGNPSGEWQLVILDLPSGDTYIVNSSSPAAITPGLDSMPFNVPIVRMYRGAQVYFTMLPVPSDAPGGPSYIWDTIRNLIEPTPAYYNMGGDTLLMTGETVSGVSDSRFAYSANAAAFPMIQFNAIHTYDPTVDGVFPFYADAEFSAWTVRFIQNGERVAAAGERSDGQRETRVLERNGSQLGSTGVNMTSLQGVFDGFVFTTDDPALVDVAGSTALYYTATRGSLPATAGTLIWNSPAGELVTIVWNSDNFTPGPTGAQAWAMLAAPASADGATVPALGVPPLPSATPAVFVQPTLAAAPGGIAVGADAYINTTDGDRLRLRGGPGLNFAVVRELVDDTRVKLMEGPRSADGYIWWRVQLEDGTSGWVVESADGVRTLLPVYAN
ncbi:MAG: SH3 domain-containing protein [Anaerolineae bacterium]|nr:SH3 domain-containing protein [Anaerolineae bacterium]